MIGVLVADRGRIAAFAGTMREPPVVGRIGEASARPREAAIDAWSVATLLLLLLLLLVVVAVVVVGFDPAESVKLENGRGESGFGAWGGGAVLGDVVQVDELEVAAELPLSGAVAGEGGSARLRGGTGALSGATGDVGDTVLLLELVDDTVALGDGLGIEFDATDVMVDDSGSELEDEDDDDEEEEEDDDTNESTVLASDTVK